MSQQNLLYTLSIWALREGMFVSAFALKCVAPESALMPSVAILPDAINYRE